MLMNNELNIIIHFTRRIRESMNRIRQSKLDTGDSFSHGVLFYFLTIFITFLQVQKFQVFKLL